MEALYYCVHDTETDFYIGKPSESRPEIWERVCTLNDHGVASGTNGWRYRVAGPVTAEYAKERMRDG